jgi:hypothetical protein
LKVGAGAEKNSFGFATLPFRSYESPLVKAPHPTSNLLQKSEFPRILKELLESLNSTQLLPKAFAR